MLLQEYDDKIIHDKPILVLAKMIICLKNFTSTFLLIIQHYKYVWRIARKAPLYAVNIEIQLHNSKCAHEL